MQTYEKYWKLTNAFTNYHGEKFLDTLSICVNFIDAHQKEEYNKEKYARLQAVIQRINPINLISIRKAINQLVKLGFVNSFLLSYHPLAKDYINARTDEKRNILLSKIVYSNSSFNRAINNNSSIKQVNFLVQTLIENGSLTREEIIALMLVDIAKQPKPFLIRNELEEYVSYAKEIDFLERKYNQIGYLYNLLNKLEGLVFVQDTLYLKKETKHIRGGRISKKGKKRDAYLHRLYKKQLQAESTETYGLAKCMLEKLAYPVLIASHIKPFIESDETEAYDVDNGLLLSRTIDSLFDLKYISFDDNGKMLFSNRLSEDVKVFWKNYKLDMNILNDKRKTYLAYHRKLMAQKDA